MHRSAIDTDDEGGMAQQPNELQKRRLVRELDTILRWRQFSMRFANDNNTGRREHATKLLDYHRRNRFAATSGVGMQNDETRERIKPGKGIARRNGKPEGLVRTGAECLRQFQISINRMLIAINGGDLIVK